MSLSLNGRLGRFATMLLAMAAILVWVGGVAAAQEQPAPKWELFGGYSWIDPNANVHAPSSAFGFGPGPIFNPKLRSERLLLRVAREIRQRVGDLGIDFFNGKSTLGNGLFIDHSVGKKNLCEATRCDENPQRCRPSSS